MKNNPPIHSQIKKTVISHYRRIAPAVVLAGAAAAAALYYIERHPGDGPPSLFGVTIILSLSVLLSWSFFRIGRLKKTSWVQNKLEARLRQNEERYRLLLQNMSDAVIISDGMTETIEFVNNAACDLFGYTPDDFHSLHLIDLSNEYDSERKGGRHIFDSHIVHHPQRLFRDREGNTIVGDTSLAGYITERDESKIILIVRDVTERRQEDETKKLTQRMNSLGNLAAGIAHEFNSLLAGALGNTNLLSLSETDPEKKQRIDKIAAALHRAARVAQKLLKFSRRGDTRKRAVQLNQTVEEVCELLKHSLPDKVTFRTALADDLDTVDLLRSQAVQLVMNLAVNAIEAMPRGGDLMISTRNIELDENRRMMLGPRSGSRFIRLTVADSGVGMDAEMVKRSFRPHVTTKMNSQQAGMGLYIVENIVNTNFGFIEIDSLPGKGTNIHIYLPAGQISTPPNDHIEPVIETGEGELLVIEDEEMVRDIISAMAERSGYRVNEAANGQEAVDLYKNTHDRIDGIILDYRLPDLSAHEVITRLRGINPQARFLVSTGLNREELAEELEKYRIYDILQKPYELDRFSQSVKTMLTRPIGPISAPDHD